MVKNKVPEPLLQRVAEFLSVVSGRPDVEQEILIKAGPIVQKALNNPPKTVADMNARVWRGANISARNAHASVQLLRSMKLQGESV